MSHLPTRLPDWMRARFTDGQRFMILCVVVGVLCGLAAVGFHYAIEGVFHLVTSTAQKLGGWQFWAVLGLAPAVGALVVGIILQKLAPSAAGSGIPQTKKAYYNDFGKLSWLEGMWRFVLGTLYVGMGNALGREGPTVHMCSAIASTVGQWAFRAKSRVQAMVPVGMGAGIAAAFNAPLSAITFVFEELLDDFSTKALGGIVVAVVISAAVSRTILGEEPVLNVHFVDQFQTAPWMLIAVPLGLAAAGTGHLLVRVLLWSRERMRNLSMPLWVRTTGGGLGVGILGLSAFALTGLLGEPQMGVFSIGYGSLDAAFDAKLAVGALLILFVFKFVAVVLSYSSGGSGGLFSPTLFLGGMLGGLFGLGLVTLDQHVHLLHHSALPDEAVGACVLLGMGAMFASVVRCPFTSLLIIFEMTRSYSLMLPLMVGNVISYYLASRWQSVPLYNALLLQDGVSLRQMPAYRGAQDYRNLPVATIMTHEVLSLKASMNAADALEFLKGQQSNYHGYPVVDAEKKLVGMAMHHELDEWLAAGEERSLEELLASQKVISISSEVAIREAARLMVRYDYAQLPILSTTTTGKVLGIITLNDIARQQNAIDRQIDG
ncbi:chloride channel protein [Sulfuriroseicoccus oceanibius]|uniref:Chloride channel protein n=1 Tax=Sulfuriroseicoccus oceanibius TaxID=2707525 RepID=A0A6B3L4B3_9BACT|nr:chloride channel protein [Sulfuriroseicoccus oceanibius]QQL45096.1 chloride channel protein [Sulfuriroseicoccus oceanibius]